MFMFVVWMLLCVVSSCGDGQDLAVHPPEAPAVAGRCADDGLCVVRDERQLFSLGFRRGERHIAIDFVRAPVRAENVVKGGTEECHRVAWANGNVAISQQGGVCPASWASPMRPLSQDDAAAYGPMMSAAAIAMSDMTTPPAWATAWRLVRQRLAEWERDVPPSGCGAPGSEVDTMTLPTHKLKHRSVSSSGGGRGDSGADHGPDTPAIRQAQVVRDEGLEYMQKVELWSHPVKEFVIFGRPTRSMWHSGTVARVFQRPRDAPPDEQWLAAQVVISRNHGAEPGYVDMRHYDTCVDFPITKGYYVTGGEGPGSWPMHLCNDDTVWQLEAARGRTEYLASATWRAGDPSRPLPGGGFESLFMHPRCESRVIEEAQPQVLYNFDNHTKTVDGVTTPFP